MSYKWHRVLVFTVLPVKRGASQVYLVCLWFYVPHGGVTIAGEGLKILCSALVAIEQCGFFSCVNVAISIFFFIEL